MSDRRLEYVRLPDLKGADVNVKKHDAAGLRLSIGTYGYTEPGLLDERTGRLVAGHGRLADLLERRNAGGAPPDGVGVDDDGEWLIPVLRGWASKDDAHARAYLAASNKLSENGGWNHDLLPGFLGDLAEQDLLGLTGFTDAELAAMLADPPDGDSWDDAFAGLPDGDKTHASRTFNLTVDQAAIVDRAIEQAGDTDLDDGGNRNAGALTRICEHFLRDRM